MEMAPLQTGYHIIFQNKKMSNPFYLIFISIFIFFTGFSQTINTKEFVFFLRTI